MSFELKKHPDFEYLTRKLNHEQKSFPKKIQLWCGFCDARIVGLGSRCSLCNQREKNGKRKK